MNDKTLGTGSTAGKHHSLNRPVALARAGLCASTLLVTAGPALAQTSTGLLEEVVVTARKREERLQETPVSVTAFGRDELRAAGIANLEDMVESVPGLTSQDGAKYAGFTIRGVGTRTQDIRADPGVGVYVDSIFIPRTDTQLLDAINIESLQVLRGPQGTLFGKNTAGGAILLNITKPGETFEGFGELNVGDQDRRYGRVGLSGPLGDTFFAGVVVNSRTEDGYMKDAETGREYGDTDRQSALLQFRWLPNDDVSADLLLFASKQRENSAPQTCRDAENPDASLARFTAPGESRDYASLCALSESLAKKDKVIADRRSLRWETDNKLAGLTVSWQVGDVLLKSVTGYLLQDNFRRDHDQDSTGLFTLNNRYAAIEQLVENGFRAADQQERTFISQEFNLIGTAFADSLDYTLGLFASREELDDAASGNLIGPGGYLGLDLGDSVLALPPDVAGFRRAEIAQFENDSEAAFFQGTWHFNEQWQLTLGGRYTREDKSVSQNNFVAASSASQLLSRDDFDALEDAIQTVVLDDSLPYAEDDGSWSEFSPSASLSMMAPEGWLSDNGLNSGMFYLSVSEGFKAGGFEIFGNESVSFDPETVLSYEFGFKLDMLNNRLRLNGALYHSDYDDIQMKVTRRLSDLETESGITNAASSTIKGAELEVTALPVEGLLINFTASYVDAQYDEFLDLLETDAGTVTVDRSDESFSFLPEQTYSLVVQYDWQTAIGVITPRISGHYKDEIFIGLDHEGASNDAAYLDSYTLWNARLAYVPESLPNLEVTLYVDNMNDKFYYGTGIIEVGSQGAAALTRGRQRSYGLQLYYNW